MSFLEVIRTSMSSQSLPEPAREALQRFDFANVTADAVYNVARAARQAGAAALAHQLLETGADEFNMKGELRYKLEAAQNLIATDQNVAAHTMLDELQLQHRDNIHAFNLNANLCVREGKYRDALALLRDAPLSETHPEATEDIVFRALRLKIYLAALDSHVEFKPPAAAAPIEKAVAVLMIRDEGDIIGQNLRHHYLLGIRKFVIVLNKCVDETESIVGCFQTEHSDAIVCTISDPVAGYYQASKTQAACEFARSYFMGIQREVDWCFILDADEFISVDAESGLRGLLNQAEAEKADFMVFHLCNACPSSGLEFRAGSSPYTHFDTLVACSVPVVIKTGFRVAIRPRIAMGNHSLYYKGIRADRCLVAAGYGARLVHLPYRSAAQIKTKVVNGGSAYEATTLHASLGLHWRRMYKDYQERGDLLLLEKLHNYNGSTTRAAGAKPNFSF